MFGASKCELAHRLVDLVADAAATTFAAFPEVLFPLFLCCWILTIRLQRLYVIEEGVIVFKGGIGPHHYLDGFEAFLQLKAD